MMFEFTRRSDATPRSGAPTFRVARLSRREASLGPMDVSHLIDCTYDYSSPRELRWHLAERFGLAPQTVALHEAV